jgi:GNAT superfamily N-acetyltransferase
MTVTIRPARLDDYETLCALFDELDEFHRRARPDFFRPFDGPARTRDQVERWCRGPDTAVLVAEGDGEVMGLAVLLTRTPSAFAGAMPRHVIELDNLVVRDDWRSRGVGRRLLEAVTEWSREQGATHVEVGVHSFNRDARRFYEHFGFFSSLDRLALAV